jgi:amino acid permease
MSGMGPLDERDWTTTAKLFDSVYALFCGVILLVSYGVLFAPILHRFMHRFHLEDVAGE